MTFSSRQPEPDQSASSFTADFDSCEIKEKALKRGFARFRAYFYEFS